MALDFPSSPSATDIHNAANGLQYVFDGVKWISQGRYDTGAINAEKLDNISSNFNGVLTTFNLKVNNITVKPASAESLHIVLAGHLQEPSTAYTINSVNGTITFASAPSNGTAFFGVVLSRLPLADTTGTSTITNANVAANAAIDGTKINPNFGSNTITGVTTTQSATDNTTKLASTAFVQTAISNLVDSSPDALNTLNELAAALGDDADFSTTITTALAAKAPLNSPTFTGTVSGISYNDLSNLPTIPSQLTTEQVQDIVGAMVTGNTETGISVTYNDAGDGTGKLNFATTTSSSSSQTFDDNVKAIFGTNNDGLEIYHDGNNSIIDDTGTGDLLLFGTSIKLQRTNSTPESLMIEAFGGNAVKLYYDGALKFETDTAGAKWSGDLFADAFTNSGGGKIKMGPSGALQIYHDNTNSIIDDSGTGSLLVYGSNVIIQESGTSNVMADFHPNTVKLYKNNKEKLITTDNGIEIKGDSSNSTDGSIQLNCSANSHGVKIKSPNHSAGQSYTIILPDNQIAVNKILKVKSVSGSGSTAIGQLEFADDSDAALPTASSTTLGGIKVGSNLSIDGNGVLSAAGQTLTSSNINAAFGDTTQLILGAADGDGDDALKLYYGTGSGTSYGVITADNGVHLQFDGANKLEVGSSGVKWIGDLFCDDSQILKLGSSADLQIYHDGNHSYLSEIGTGSLFIDANSGIFIRGKTGEESIIANADGAVLLYNDNSKKFETTSSGVSVTGAITATGNITTGSNSSIFAENNLRFKSTGDAFIDHNTTGQDINFRVSNSSSLDTTPLVVNASGVSVTGNITVTGTVDGVDIAALNTTVSGISSPTASTINALYEDNGNFILGTGTGSDTMKLYYNGTHGFITADNGVQLQYDGSTKFSTQSTGVKWVGDLFCDDSQYLKLGSSADLQIYHDGSTSVITSASHPLAYYSNTRHHFLNGDGSEVMAVFVADGQCELYFNGSKKFETYNGGCQMGGDLSFSDNQVANFGTGSDLQIYHNGSTSYIKDTGTGNLRLATSKGEFRNAADTETLAAFTENGGVELYYANSKKLEVFTWGVEINGDLGLDDNRKVALGNGPDLEIYHDGSNSYFANGTGATLITGSSVGNIAIKPVPTEDSILGVPNANVKLYYDGSLKFETMSTGAKWHGDLFCDDSQYLKLGSSADLQLYHDGSHSYIKNSTNYTYYLSTQHLFKNVANNELQAKFQENAGAQLFYDNASKLETISGGVKFYGHIYADDNKEVRLGNSGDLQLWHDGTNNHIYSATGTLYVRGDRQGFISAGASEWGVKYEVNSFVQLFYDNALKLETQSSGVKWFGDLYCDDNQTIKLGSSADLKLYHSGHSVIENTNSSAALLIASHGTNIVNAALTENLAKFEQNGSVRLYYDDSMKFKTVNAGIEVTGSCNPDQHNLRDLGASNKRWATLYVVNQPNVSDRNEKNTIQHSDLGLSFINKLNPVSFRWNDTSLGTKTRYGLIAQEVEEAVKKLGKDINDIGMIDKPKEGSMGLCTNELIAPLVKAIQELSARVAVLEGA